MYNLIILIATMIYGGFLMIAGFPLIGGIFFGAPLGILIELTIINYQERRKTLKEEEEQ